MICPICLRDLSTYSFEKHHVVWRTFGGSNAGVNLLDICCDCHGSLTYGKTKEAQERNNACFFHQLAYHGLTFLLKSNVMFADHKTPWSSERFLERVEGYGAEAVDANLREIGYSCYRQCLDKLTGIGWQPLPWEIVQE